MSAQPIETETSTEYVVEEFLPVRGTWLPTWGGGGPKAYGYLSHEQDARDKMHSLEAEEAHLPEAEQAKYRIVQVTSTVEKTVLA